MDKKQRFNEAYTYLVHIGRIRTQKELAEIMQSTSPNISSARKGIESVLTDNFLMRFYNEFSDIFNKSWIITGEGEMLRQSQSINGDGNVQVGGNANNVNAGAALDNAIKEISNAHALMAKMQEQMDRMLAVIENLSNTKMA